MQWTVRDVPLDLDARLRELAQDRGLSLNKTMIQVLREALGGGPGSPSKKRDLSGFIRKAREINSKSDLKAMDKAWKGMERIEPGEWQ